VPRRVHHHPTVSSVLSERGQGALRCDPTVSSVHTTLARATRTKPIELIRSVLPRPSKARWRRSPEPRRRRYRGRRRTPTGNVWSCGRTVWGHTVHQVKSRDKTRQTVVTHVLPSDICRNGTTQPTYPVQLGRHPDQALGSQTHLITSEFQQSEQTAKSIISPPRPELPGFFTLPAAQRSPISLGA